MKNKYIYLAILAAGFISCEPEFENPVSQDYSAGEADFSSYVAIGNSLTAGFMDGTMYKSGQMNSFPNLLSQQFATVGGGAFTQPSFDDDTNNLGGFAGVPGSTRRILDATQVNPNGTVGAVENIAGMPTISLTNRQNMAYNNMGVPGAKTFHLVTPGYAAFNPYFARHAVNLSTSTVLGDAMTKAPTFFTNWIGANDILSYATSGGTMPDNPATPADESLLPATDQTGNPNAASYGVNDITDPTLFGLVYTQIINTLTSGTNPAKGVVATIPNVTSIPYFTTVPFAPLSPAALGGAANITALNTQLYGPLNAIFSSLGEPNRVKLLSATAANPLLIYDENATDRSAQITGALTSTLGAQTATAFGAVFGKARQATASDLIVLTASSVIGTPNASSPSPLINLNGVSYPLPSKWVLTVAEQTKVTTATNAYNNSIKGIAASKNLAVADMNAILGELVSGLKADNGTIYTANYFSGGTSEFKVLFSLDGVHPNARGYSVIANEIIKVINSHYKANIPLVNPNNYPGINILATN